MSTPDPLVTPFDLYPLIEIDVPRTLPGPRRPPGDVRRDAAARDALVTPWRSHRLPVPEARPSRQSTRP